MKADAAAREKDWETAMDYYVDGLKKRPKDVRPYLGIAKIHFETGNMERSIEYLHFAEAHDAVNRDALCGLAERYSDSTEKIRYRSLCAVVTSTLSIEEKRRQVIEINQKFEYAKQFGYEPVEVPDE